MLWTRLRSRPAGLKFRRQHPAGPFVLDFFCSDAMLAIEIDGIAHDLGERPARDEARDAWLAEKGVTVMRLAAVGVARDVDGAAASIVSTCLARLPLHRPAGRPPPRAGEET